MVIRITCAQCSKVLGIPREAVGKKIRCVGCQAVCEAVPNAEIVGPAPPPLPIPVPAAGIADQPLPVARTPAVATLPSRAPVAPVPVRTRPDQRDGGTPWGLIITLSSVAGVLVIGAVVGLILYVRSQNAAEEERIAAIRAMQQDGDRHAAGMQLMAEKLRAEKMAAEQRQQEERIRQELEKLKIDPPFNEQPFKPQLDPPFKLPPEPPQPPPLPRMSLRVAKKMEAFSTAVVSADSTQAVAFLPSGKVKLLAAPTFDLKGQSDLGKEVYEAVLDSKGMLYAVCASKPRKGPIRPKVREPADLSCYDLGPILNGQPMPARLEPTRTIPLDAVVESLILSPDQRWLYFLDSRQGRIGRVNLTTGVLEGELQGVEGGTKSMCLTPDGKKLFTCSPNGILQEFDAAAWRAGQRWSLNHRVSGIQATDKGLVFLNGAEGQWTNIWRFDTTKGGDAPPWTPIYHSNALKLSRDQKVLFVSCWHLSPANVTAYWVADEGPRARSVAEASLNANFSARGQLVLSPDGRFLLCDSGYILQFGD